MELSSMLRVPMDALLHTEFSALLARAGVSQAGFARLSGLTPRPVNNWCRGRAAIPPWAAALGALLEQAVSVSLTTRQPSSSSLVR